MKRLFLILLIMGFIVGLLNFPANAQIPDQPPRKIVVFREGCVNEAAQIELVKGLGAIHIKQLSLINGMAVYLPAQAEKALLGRSEVLRIDDDLVITATAKSPSPLPQPAQVVPWGVNRIGAPIAWSITTGLTVKVAILDTGIQLTHPDLQDNIKGNVNIIIPTKSGNDDNGHGTHVAGIVAAINNDIGVVGVGPKIYLYAVKVLGKNGSGWLSDIITGLDWCINNKIQVTNMSFGSSGDNQSFHDAIIKAYQAGIVLVAAAGNNGQTGGAIDYPGKYPETIAVSAVDQNNQIAYFSSYGPEIALAAPGVNILSTYNNGYYKTLSGTSMAAPHVTGTAALVLTTAVGSYDLNGNGKWDPAEVKNKLETTAENLGLPSYDQGAGLVRADLAVQ